MTRRTTDFSYPPDSGITFVRPLPSAGRAVYRCRCGREFEQDAYRIRTGGVKSCGCARIVWLKSGRVPRAVKHGKSDTNRVEYTAWNHLRSRCRTPTDKEYPRYGGRGISVCARWDDFAAFLVDMGVRPTPKHSIDRIRVNGGYWCGRPACSECGPLGRTPNCRWATAKEQQRNRRDSRLLTWNNRTMHLLDWAAEIGITPQALARRVRVWGIDRALTAQKGPRTGPRPMKL